MATALVHPGMDVEPQPRMTLVSGPENPMSWWIPNEACLREWFKAAGLREFGAQRTVKLTVDPPLTDESGRRISGAQDETLLLVDAYA